MLIDTKRFDDFLREHSCHIINEEKTLEDKVTYPVFTTNRYESVFKQLQTDIEVEKAYVSLEDVLVVEDEDGRLVLNSPYEFTAGGRTYSYEADTPLVTVWEDMFKLHSKGAGFTYSTEYKDISLDNGSDKTISEADKSELIGSLIDTVEDFLESKGITKEDIANGEREAEDEYTAIIYGSDYDYLADKFSSTLGMNDRQTKDRLQQDIIKPVPDTMLKKFLNSEVAIKIYNRKQHDAIMSQLKETGIDLKLEEFGDYDKDYPYYHIDKNVNSSKRSLNASMDMRHVIESKGIRWCVDFDSLDRIRKNTEEKEKTVKKNKDQYER